MLAFSIVLTHSASPVRVSISLIAASFVRNTNYDATHFVHLFGPLQPLSAEPLATGVVSMWPTTPPLAQLSLRLRRTVYTAKIRSQTGTKVHSGYSGGPSLRDLLALNFITYCYRTNGTAAGALHRRRRNGKVTLGCKKWFGRRWLRPFLLERLKKTTRCSSIHGSVANREGHNTRSLRAGDDALPWLLSVPVKEGRGGGLRKRSVKNSSR